MTKHVEKARDRNRSSSLEQKKELTFSKGENSFSQSSIYLLQNLQASDNNSNKITISASLLSLNFELLSKCNCTEFEKIISEIILSLQILITSPDVAISILEFTNIVLKVYRLTFHDIASELLV